MKKETARLVGEIAALAHEQNAPDYAVMMYYNGHVKPETVSITVYESGWRAYTAPSHAKGFVREKPSTLKETLLWMKRIHAEFRASNPAHQRAETVQKQVGVGNA